MGDEELAAAGIAPQVQRHADDTAEVRALIELVPNRIAGATVAIALRIAGLNHEIRDHAMNGEAVEESLPCEGHETLDGERRIQHRQLDLDRSSIGVDV